MAESNFDWTFEGASTSGYSNGNPTVVLNQDDMTRLIFHPAYSNGTAGIRGAKPLSFDRHHFFEFEMLSPVYGTDCMIGVGTENASVDSHLTSFTSLLGIDRESWGFSYLGDVQHASDSGHSKRKYCPDSWREGSLVGCHFDGWRGTLEFYHNRRPLGVAFTIPKTSLVYPMISSTTAKLSIKLTMSFSQTASLCFEASMVLCHQVWIDEDPSQNSGLDSYFVQNNRPLHDHIPIDKVDGLKRSLPPLLQRYIDQSCWFAMGCKFQDLKGQETTEIFTQGEMYLLWSDDDEVVLTDHKLSFKRLYSELSDASETAEDDDPWPLTGPGPSVDHFNKKDESFVVRRTEVEKQQQDGLEDKPRLSRRLKLPGAHRNKRGTKKLFMKQFLKTEE